MNNLFNVSDKTALVTGSSRGLGFTLAKGLAEAGCNVILNGTTEKTLNEAVEKLRSRGYKANGYLFDVRNEDEIVEKVNMIKEETGTIDILVNNAGIQVRGALEDFNLSDWQRLIGVNLTGAFLVSKAVVKDMIKGRRGKIINICSIQSELARPSIAPYTASKGGLKNITKGMATDWGKYNIQINGIAPGYFKTDMTRALYTDEKFNAWLCNRTPANRWGEPEELIGSLIFLASDASNYVNGHIIYVDGGMLACV